MIGKPTLAGLGDICLEHLASDPEQLAHFMGVSGYSPASLRAALNSEALARGLIEYFAQNEALLMQLCASHGLTPEAFMRIWAQINPPD